MGDDARVSWRRPDPPAHQSFACVLNVLSLTRQQAELQRQEKYPNLATPHRLKGLDVSLLLLPLLPLLLFEERRGESVCLFGKGGVQKAHVKAHTCVRARRAHVFVLNVYTHTTDNTTTTTT